MKAVDEAYVWAKTQNQTLKSVIGDKDMKVVNSEVMLDIETLGIADNAVITEIALRHFAFFLENGQYRPVEGAHTKIDLCPMQQIVSGRTIDADTVRWWKETNNVKYNSFMGYRTSPYSAASMVSQFFLGLPYTPVVWARAPDFDCRILGNFMKQQDYRRPWRFQNQMDHRSVLRLAGVKHTADGVHDALGDVDFQIASAFEALKKLGKLY